MQTVIDKEKCLMLLDKARMSHASENNYREEIGERINPMARAKNQAFQEAMQIVSVMEVYQPPQIMHYNVWCENDDCDFSIPCISWPDLLVKLSEEGGYITSDGEGGYYDRCPKCKCGSLSFER